MARVKAVHVIHAYWCPHCHPTTVEPLQRAAAELGIDFFAYDIDVPEQEKRADELVRKFGRWEDDYLIPQVFVEMTDGKVSHVLTGVPGSVASTKKAVDDFIARSLQT